MLVISTGKLVGGAYNAGKTFTIGSGATLRLNSWGYDTAGSLGGLDYGRDRLVVNGGIIEVTGNSSESGRIFTVGTGGATLRSSVNSGQTWTLFRDGNVLYHDIRVNDGRTLTLDGTGNGAIGNHIVNTSGTGNITKAGAGTWTLSGANTYTGTTTINAGTLKLAAGSLTNTAIAVNGTGIFAVQPGSTATLSAGTTGAGTAGATLNLGSRTFDMADGFISTFNLRQQDSFASAALTLTDGATLKFNVGNSGTDLLAVTKGASVSGTIDVIISTNGATSLTPGTNNLVTAASGLTAGSPIWQFSGGGVTQAIIVGATAYGLTLSATDTAVQLIVTNIGAADAAHSTVSPATATRQANGISTQVITVQARDVNNFPQLSGGETVVISATTGTVSSVTDNDNGTYTATWTSPTSVGSGTATITATLGGVDVGTAVGASSCVITLTAPADAAHSTISPPTATKSADGTGTQVITVQARDVNDINQTAGGATVVISATTGTVSSVTDNNDGTYTATWTSPTTLGSGTATVSATLEGLAVGTAVGASNCVITLTVGAANAAHSTVSPATATHTANGTSTQLITVQARDVANNNRTSGGDTVTISATAGTMGNVTDVGDGTYTATWTAPTSTGSGTASVTATLGGVAIGTAVAASNCVITLTAGAVDAAHSTVSPATAYKKANGISTQVITVRARDVNNNNRTSGGDTVTMSATDGTLGSVTDVGNGTYTATWTAPASLGSGSATVTATLGGTAVGTAVAASSCVITLLSFDYTWDGTSNSWSSAHWLPGSVVGPTGTDPLISVSIPSGTVTFVTWDTFGQAATASSPAITVNGGTLASGGYFNTIWNLSLNSGTLLSNGGANSSYGSFDLAGTVTAGGGGTSFISSGTGVNNIINLGSGTSASSTTFNIASNSSLIISTVLNNHIYWNSSDRTVAGSLIKTGAGTLTLSAANTYTGATTINEGTLALGASNVLANTTTISIGSATLDAATFADTIGTLDVTSASSTIRLGTGGTLAFADSSAISWTGGRLNITGNLVSGSSLRFGTSSAGLTRGQLDLISFSRPGYFALNESGYLTFTCGTVISFF
jgi:autotransporter-associated beta strand protein